MGKEMPYSELIKILTAYGNITPHFILIKTKALRRRLMPKPQALSRPKRLLLLCLMIILYPKLSKYQSQPKGFDRNI